MNEQSHDAPRPDREMGSDLGDHPRGTLFIVALMGLLYAIGWVALYWVFLARDGIHP